jgi:hypothetical protein
MRTKTGLAAFVPIFFNVFSALTVYFNISRTVENCIYKKAWNNLHIIGQNGRASVNRRHPL